MTQSELVDLMLYMCQENCSQVVGPEYYENEGPFIFAIDESNVEPKFLCFTFAGSDEFLSNPSAMPFALESDDFLIAFTDRLNLTHLWNSGKPYLLTYHKIVPDEPACRIAVQKLWVANPGVASSISLLSAELDLQSARTLCENQPLLS